MCTPKSVDLVKIRKNPLKSEKNTWKYGENGVATFAKSLDVF